MEESNTILVVDDEPDILFFIKKLLEGNGHSVCTALSGQEGMDILSRSPVDILITDIRMPGMDGIELIKRAVQCQPGITSIVLTGHEDIETTIEAMKAGAINYLAKPVNFDELLVTLQKAQEKCRLQQNFKDQQRQLEEANRQLEQKVADRTAELSAANRELTHALKNIKTLKKLLPICASCKKIRDDQGYWSQIETYIHKHVDTDFSHGICPDCAQKLYPEIYDPMEDSVLMQKTERVKILAVDDDPDVRKVVAEMIEALGVLPHPFYVIDVKDYTVKLANTVSGFDPAKLGTQTCYFVTHKRNEPCDSLEHPCPLQEILKTKKPYTVEHVHYDADGNEINVEVHAYPLFDEQGEVQQIIEYSLDITQRKMIEAQLLASEAKYREFVEGSSDLITQVDQQGRFTFVNHTAEDILGCTPQDCIGKSAFEFIHPEDRQDTEAWFQEVIAKKLERTSFENRHRNLVTGKVVHLSWTCAFDYDQAGELLLVNSSAKDISSHILIQAELRKAKESAEKADQLKSEFLANMSHEIRTPMNAILGMNRLALEHSSSPEQQHYLAIVQSSAESLLGLINDILDFSKIETGQVDLDEAPFDLDSTLKAVIQVVAVDTSKKGLEINYNVPAGLHTALMGDEYRLRQILLNLIYNAVKFTETGGISLEVEELSATKTETVLQFKVKDTGCGISAEAQEHIFDRFSQANSSATRKSGGTGLGLTICRMLTDLLGGRIWVESEPGKGSIFYFTARYLKCDPSLVTTHSPDSGKLFLPPLDILVVEDNQFNRDLVKIVLEEEGHTVICAENGVEALEKLVTDNVDLVLMDVQMPELDGIATTKLIRACENRTVISSKEHQELLVRLQNTISGTRIPIIAMTAQAMSGDRRRCLEAGMDNYVTKPFKPEKLFKVIAEVTGQRLFFKEVPDLILGPEQEKRGDGCKPANIEEIRNHLMENYKISLEEANVILKSSRESVIKNINTAEEAFSRGDLGSMSSAAHSLKGVLSTMGLHCLAELAKRVEKSQARAAEELTKGLKEQLRVLRKALAQLL